MDKEELQKMLAELRQDIMTDVEGYVGQITAPAAEAEEVEEEVEVNVEVEVIEDDSSDQQQAVDDAVQEARLARCELRLDRALGKAKLTPQLEAMIRGQFDNIVFEEKTLTEAIKRAKEAQAAMDTSGRAAEASQTRDARIEVGMSPEEK